MAERPPLQQVRGTAQLNPVAGPVDAFVAPGKNRLLEFAESLGKVSAPLQEFIAQRAEKANKEDILRGQAAFYADNADGMAEGVRTGRIPPQYSPAFVRGWKLAQGSVAGGNLREQFAAEYDAWEGKNSDDPVAFDTFYQDFLRRNLDPNSDPAVLEGLLPSVREIEANGRSRHIEHRAKHVYDGALEAGTAGVAQDVDAANAAGLTDPEGTDYNGLFGNIFKRREAFTSTGGSAEDFDKKIIDAVSLKVIETRDPGLLKFFDQTVPGKAYKYGDTDYGAKVKQATIENLEVIARRSETEQAQQDTKEAKAAEDRITQQTMEILVADPGADIPDGMLRQAEKYMPDFRYKVVQWREAFNKGFTDEQDLKAVYTDILNGGGTGAVSKAWGNGVFGRPEDLNAAMTFARSFEDNRSKISDAIASPTAKDLLGAIDVRTKGKTDIGEPIGGMSNEGFEAQYDFKRKVQEWVIKNPDASLQDREDAINKIGKSILDRIPEPEDPMSGSAYDRAAGEEFDNPFTNGTAPVDEGLPQEGEEEEAADPNAATEDEVRKFLQQMTPEQRSAFDKTATEKGITSQDLGQQLLDQNEALRPISYNPNDTDLGEGDARDRGFSTDEASALLDEAFSENSAATSDGQVAGLKALIRQHEARGNYNAVYGNAKATTDLSQFSLDDILAHQQRARRRGAASTAIGAYQFIYKTLRGLKSEMGLTGKEAFTPELQERMADVLLERRGLSRFREGRMSKRAFALQLSQEWASLPNPSTGRSYYAGDGLNASSVPRSKVYAALGFGDSMTDASPVSSTMPVNKAYAKIPDVDGNGQAGQQAKFMEWNNDPVGNHEANLDSVDPTLADVVRLAQTKAGVQFVVGSGRRDALLQKKAREWGWSQTDESDHLHGGAVDLWGIDGDGAVTFDKKTQAEIVKAMKAAAKELGVELDVGADWKRKDNPHFALKGRPT